MPTKIVGQSGDAVTFEIEYNDNLRITRLRVTNNSDQAAYFSAKQTSDGRTHGARFEAQADTYVVVPTTVAERLQMTMDGRGRLDGVEFQTIHPYD